MCLWVYEYACTKRSLFVLFLPISIYLHCLSISASLSISLYLSLSISIPIYLTIYRADVSSSSSRGERHPEAAYYKKVRPGLDPSVPEHAAKLRKLLMRRALQFFAYAQDAEKYREIEQLHRRCELYIYIY